MALRADIKEIKTVIINGQEVKVEVYGNPVEYDYKAEQRELHRAYIKEWEAAIIKEAREALADGQKLINELIEKNLAKEDKHEQ